jgi:hypothetical protein
VWIGKYVAGSDQPNLRYQSSTFFDELEKTTENFSQGAVI